MENNPFLSFAAPPEPDLSQIEIDLEVYEKGRQLQAVVNTPGWEIALDTLRAYRDKTSEDLLDLPIGDPSVLLAHAAQSALRQMFRNFEQDIANAIRTASKPPEELRDYLYDVKKNSDPSNFGTSSLV